MPSHSLGTFLIILHPLSSSISLFSIIKSLVIIFFMMSKQLKSIYRSYGTITSNQPSISVTKMDGEFPRKIRIQFTTCGNYSLTIVEGLTSLSNTFYGVFKRRLHCPGKCADDKIEPWNAYPRDVVRILFACDFPEETITVQER